MSSTYSSHRGSIGDESSSIMSTSSTDAIASSSPAYHTNSLSTLSSDRQQLNASSRQTQSNGADLYREHDQRQHGNGQPLPPGSGSGSGSSSTMIAPSSPTAPSDLSSYARLMLQHTKQQLDATSASPPPPHIRVAGPLGHSQHQQRRRHAHSASLPNGTSPIMNGVPASRS